MSKTDTDIWLRTLRERECLTEKDLLILCTKVKEILSEESNIQPVASPVTVAGDIHG
jgi:hypothetical protein